MFRASGWGVKSLHRLIVTSATYRQTSKVTPSLLERDPQNRLLAWAALRQPRGRSAARQRLGLRPPMRTVGGAPVKPYQPGGVWEEATFGNKRYQSDHGAALYRRSLYTFWRRIVGPTEFFDTAARQVCVVKPTRTNTPTQALITLNDVTFVEAYHALARHRCDPHGQRRKRAWIIDLSPSCLSASDRRQTPFASQPRPRQPRVRRRSEGCRRLPLCRRVTTRYDD